MAKKISLSPAKVVGTISGNSPEVSSFSIGDGQEIKKGQFVYLNNGKVYKCGNGAMAILGMAAEDSNTKDKIKVYIANSDTIFEMNVYFDGDEDEDDKVSENLLGNKYGLVIVQDNCHIDISNSANPSFKVRKISPKDSSGDIYGRVLAQVTREASQM